MICVPYIMFWNQFIIKNIMFSLNWIGMLLSTFLHKWWHSLGIGLSSLWNRRASLSSYLNPTLITDGDAFDQRDRTARGTHLLPVTCLFHLSHNFIADQCFDLLWLGCMHRVTIRYYCWCLRGPGRYAAWMLVRYGNTLIPVFFKVECYVSHFILIKQAGHNAWNLLVG